MKEGDNISFKIGEETKYGKIIKIYTKIGFEDHGKEFVVVSLYDSHLRFYEGDIEIMNQNINILE